MCYIYTPLKGDPKIIGTGSYIDGSLWSYPGLDYSGQGVVATARHNFSEIPISRLYVRFFHYNVSFMRNSQFYVEEDFIDVPVISTYVAQGGLDAGVLHLLPLSNSHLKKYTRKATSQTASYRDSWANINPGKYAMFHFSGADHQISVGHVYSPPSGSWTSSNIHIEAGPGASGAAIFSQVGDYVTTEGISIYRHLDDYGIGRSMLRRIIPYARFVRPGILTDSIEAPYRKDPYFRVFSVRALDQDGYEFLINIPTGREDRPMDVAYNVDANMANHHIIPIGKLLYLWDYFHNPYALPREVWDATHRRKGAEKEYDAHAKKRYDTIKKLMYALTANQSPDRSQFAWARWNLFQGWNKDYRKSDPASDLEEDRPYKFPEEQWTLVHDDLNSRIDQLWCTAQRSDPEAICDAQQKVLTSLQQLRSYLLRSPGRLARIYSFHEDEWVVTGSRNGHHLYSIK